MQKPGAAELTGSPILLFFPFPACNLGKVETVFMDILFVLNKFVAHLLVEVSASVSELGKVLDCFHYKVETVNIVLHTNVERRCNGSFFFVTTDVHQTVVVAAVGQLVNKVGIAVEGEDYRFILGEEQVIFRIGQAVRMLGLGLQLEEVNNVDKTYLDLGQFLVEYGNCCKSFKCGSFACAGKYNVGFCALVVGSPVPYADTLCAVLDCFGH